MTVQLRCVSEVCAVAARIFSSLDEIATALQAVFDRAEAAGRKPDVREVQALRAPLLEHLARHGQLFDGTGVVIQPGMLADRERYLEWWRGPGPQRLSLDLDTTSEGFYDYTRMEWFAAPRDARRRVAHGPWVDYSGADRYVITFARPVEDAGGRFLGVAGADAPLSAVEKAVMPALRSAATPVALVNAHGRVVASTDLAAAPGVLLRSIAEKRATPVTELGGGWRLVDLATE